MTTPKKKTSGSPAPHQSRAQGTSSRPNRTPVSGNRDILTVAGKDPDFVYRWVKDTSEDGQRIMTFLQAAYEFVDASSAKQHGIGANNVYNATDVGTLIRKPAGDGEYLYLMRIPREFYEEDKAAQQQEITRQERQITRERDPHSKGDDGQYGSIKIS